MICLQRVAGWPWRTAGRVSCILLLAALSCSDRASLPDAAHDLGVDAPEDGPVAEAAPDGPVADDSAPDGASADLVPTTGWAVAAGGNAGSDRGTDIALSSTGTACVAGSYTGPASFGATTLQGSGSFVARLDAAGQWAWAVPVSGATVTDVAINDAGSCYVTGWFNTTLALGSSTLSPNGELDLFVARLDSSGSWQWAAAAGGKGRTKGNGVAVDPTGHVHVTGSFDSPTAFGSTTVTAQGGDDLFGARLKPDGSWDVAVAAGSTGDDRGFDLAVDAYGNCVVVGQFAGTVSFGTTQLTSQGDADIFVARLNPKPGWSWALSAGGPGEDRATSVALHSSGDSAVSGTFSGSASFGSTTLSSGSSFVASTSLPGAWQWASATGATAMGVTLDNAGNSYLAGSFAGTATFGATTLPAHGFADLFVSQLDPSGLWQWTASSAAGSTTQRRALAVAANPAGQVVATGYFGGTAVLGSTTLTTAGSNFDVFVWRVQ